MESITIVNHAVKFESTIKIETDMFECTDCNEAFDSSDKLDQHLYEIHKKGIKCLSCLGIVPNKESIPKHVSTCEKTIKQDKIKPKEKLSKSVTVKKFAYQCIRDGCNEIFNSMVELYKHNVIHKVGVKIPETNSATPDGESIKRTPEYNKNEDSIIKSNEKLEVNRTKTFGFTYNCTELECKKTFGTKFKLDEHMFNFHKVDSKCYTFSTENIVKKAIIKPDVLSKLLSKNNGIKEDKAKRKKREGKITINGFLCSKCSKILLKKEELSNHFAKCNQQMDTKLAIKNSVGYNFNKSFVEIKLYEVLKEGFCCCKCCKFIVGEEDIIDHAISCAEVLVRPTPKAMPISGQTNNNLVCGICKNVYKDRCYYRQHLKTHIPEYAIKLKCPECLFIAEHPDSLKHHIQHIHVKRDKYVCYICGKMLYYRFMERHLETHKTEKNHKCTECGKMFLARDSLGRHKLIHRQIKAHVCDQCGKTFTYRQNMLVHKRIHTGERPYSCIICRKGFISIALRKSHKCKGYTE